MYHKTRKILSFSLNYIVPKSSVSSVKIDNFLSRDDVIISESCVTRLKQLCGKDNTLLRVSVESGGCSGFQYKFELDNKVADDDRVYERDGAKVIIDETSLEYIKGSTIDYHTELIRSAFRVVKNPNSDLGCSCGASFSVKID